MNFESRLAAFMQLGVLIKEYLNGKDNSKIETGLLKAEFKNPWFIKNFSFVMLHSITEMLNEKHLLEWVSRYPDLKTSKTSKTIGLILAGNIPLVGFHDILCVLLSGHKLQGKLSSKDEILTQTLIDLLIEIEPEFQSFLQLTNKKLKGIEAIIATGSDNSARYFEHYFGKYPNIIRKNRNSIAILSGNENAEELMKLSNDIFLYFGLGCRNISKILIPKDYDFNKLIEAFKNYQYLIYNNKYANNYNYYKSIYLMNSEEFIDTEFLLIKENNSLHSPIANLHYEYYNTIEEVEQNIKLESQNIQCIATNIKTNLNAVKLGQTQHPKLWDYSDNIDTFAFLLNLQNS
jgi:hypothetical protein